MAARVPRGFEAYARILHPIQFRNRPVTWTELAAIAGTELHTTTRAVDLLATAEKRPLGNWVFNGQFLNRNLKDWAQLVLALQVPTTERLTLGFTQGICGLHHPELDSLDFHGIRSFYLAEVSPLWLSNPPPQIHDGFLSLMWPSDRSWFASTDVDDFASYIGGTRAVIDAIMACPDLETTRAQPDDPVV